MKILLLRPYVYIDKKDFPFPISEPIGLEYLAAMIRDNHEVKIVDCIGEGWNEFSEIFNQPNMIMYGKGDDFILKEIESFKPDVVGVNASTSFDEYVLFSVLQLIKSKYPTQKVIIGGVYASTEKAEIFKKTDNVDIIVYGEGEGTIKELADKEFENLESIKGIIFKKDGQVIVNPPRELLNLDNIPFPARDLVKLRNYSRLVKYQVLGHELGWFKTHRLPKLPEKIDDIFEYVFRFVANSYITFRNLFRKDKEMLMMQPTGNILSSRGCPNDCIFCAIHNVYGYKYRMRSAENVLEEIDILVKLGMKSINFIDDNVTVSKDRMVKICNGVIEKGYKIQLHNANGTFLPTLDEELIVLMKKAGYRSFAFGVETGNQDTMDNVINKKQDLNKVRCIVKICRKHGIKTTSFFVIGMPGETVQSMKDTVQFARETGFDKVQLYICQIVPGSRAYDLAMKNKWLLEDWSLINSRFQGERCFLKTPEFNPGDVEEVFKKAMEDSFFRFY